MSRKQIRLRAQNRAQKNKRNPDAAPSPTPDAGVAEAVAEDVVEGIVEDVEEQRKHPRIQVPLLVEIQHPSLGRQRCVAKDISQGGVYVTIEGVDIRSGANVKLTLLNSNSVYRQPTPTVDMEVVRADEHGMGLKFISKTSQHLWQSVEHFRRELAIGRDYFQIHVSPVVINERGQLLVVQQHGYWTFPGAYLVVGANWRQVIQQSLRDRFALRRLHIDHILDMTSSNSDELPEAATMKIFVLIHGDAGEFSFPDSGYADSHSGNTRSGDSLAYKSYRWLANKRDLAELSFINEQTRQIAGNALDEPAVQA